MQIVIDIPEEEYKNICLMSKDGIGMALYDWVANGKPLPKGHGRLIDADDLEAEMINGIKAGNYEEGYEEYAHINDMDDCIDCVRYTPTIIEGSDSE